MNAAPHDIDQVRERASLYALGALGDDEARAFEAHLNANCSLCTSELAAFSAVVDEVARQTPPQTPPTALRARVLERVAGDAERTHPQSLTKEGLLFAYSNRIPWTALPFPGLDIKVLSTDETKATSTQPL